MPVPPVALALRVVDAPRQMVGLAAVGFTANGVTLQLAVRPAEPEATVGQVLAPLAITRRKYSKPSDEISELGSVPALVTTVAYTRNL